jgi:hypothetical protein
MKIQEVLERFGYKLSGGSKYCWNCYGDNAWRVEYQEEVEFIFDLISNELYEVNVWCAERQESLIYVTPKFEIALYDEADERGFPIAVENKVFSLPSILQLAEQQIAGEDLDLDLCNFIEVNLEGDVYEQAKELADAKGISMEEYVSQALEEWHNNVLVQAEKLGITPDEYLVQTYSKDIEDHLKKQSK